MGRLNVLDLQIQIRRLPKPVIAMVAGYAIGGGHVLHLCCDLTIAADNARFGQTGPRVGSFDAGYGIGLLARQIGEKRAKEVWFLCRQYDAATALTWGLVNAVVPLEELEEETVRWAKEMLAHSPLALRLLKAVPTPASTGSPASNSSPATRPSSITWAKRRRKAGTPTWRSDARTSRGSRSGRERLGHRRTPPTLGAGVVPVLVGAAAADAFIPWRFVAALIVALGLQVGVNYANDFFDGIRGVDTPARLGPPRLVASGAASPKAVLVAALIAIGAAGSLGSRSRW